ncbi:hypothetical protein [Natronosalvus rutilus]|uniref:Uncharacterized protein n=1 Tax=Natronosalvus rutilus TaxID=2953753 RepID=A0A9E7NE57_9EURY|nr:hypothetical protein [Natronosalvus rutilus]UTF55831.1 hypothetical protein NGM29_20320 [Natronosalvus rutilus]
MKWRKLVATDSDNDVHDEEILNVFRRSDDEMLGNANVAEVVDLGTERVKQRLQTLAEEDRVEGKKIGGSWVWTLDRDERRKPVPPNIDRLIHILVWIDEKARLVITIGLLAAVTGLSLLYWGVTEAFIISPVSGISPTMMMAAGWSFTVTGGLFTGAAGLAVLGLRVIERLAISRVTKPRPAEPTGRSRGQVTPRLILGGFVLVLIAGPLAAAAVDIQDRLASTSTFSPLAAAVIALLIIAVIVAAIFDSGR